jgi:hypothetical protein
MSKYAAVAAAGKLADKQISILREAIGRREAATSSNDQSKRDGSGSGKIDKKK